LPKYFAIARSDHSFIVHADTREELITKIDEIRDKYYHYYQKYIAPGYYVVQAETLREAKAGRKQLLYDLPLFKAPVLEYRIYRQVAETGETVLLDISATLQQAKDWFKAHPEENGQIVVVNGAGEVVKIYSPETFR
jgi:hypothetical protein